MKPTYKWSFETPEEEKELIQKYLDGDGTAFGPLYHKYKAIFYWMARKWYPSLIHEDLEDMSLEFLGRISQKLHLYDPNRAQVNTWMTRCIRYYLIEWGNRKSTRERGIEIPGLLQKSREGDYELDIPTDHDMIGDISYRNILRSIYQTLGPEDTRIFELHYLQGHSQARTGKILGLDPNTMWYRIKKIRKQLGHLNPYRE